MARRGLAERRCTRERERRFECIEDVAKMTRERAVRAPRWERLELGDKVPLVKLELKVRRAHARGTTMDGCVRMDGIGQLILTVERLSRVRPAS